MVILSMAVEKRSLGHSNHLPPHQWSMNVLRIGVDLFKIERAHNLEGMNVLTDFFNIMLQKSNVCSLVVQVILTGLLWSLHSYFSFILT